MSTQVMIQYATLISLAIGMLGLGLAVSIHRQQITTQIFLELSARFDALLNTLPISVWRSTEGQLPAQTDELAVSVFRYFSLVSFGYFLFQQGRIPKNMWELMRPSVERTIRNLSLIHI